MKKKVMLALAIIMVLGSVKAMALTEEEAYIMNQQTKIDAVEADVGCSTCADGDSDIIEGKLQAAAKVSMVGLIEDSRAQVKEIRKIGNDIGTAMDDSHGLIKFLGQQEEFAVEALKEMKMIEKSVDGLEGEATYVAYEKLSKLADRISELNRETKTTVEKVLKEIR
ncbi:hypothetical protein [Bdellovibrio bacteriovorus]|uniref:hypothetical protein n=1 Tax=Bdellovibrio bacteriovorus TaxID=959 RepID=UPI0035A6D7AB